MAEALFFGKFVLSNCEVLNNASNVIIQENLNLKKSDSSSKFKYSPWCYC